MDPEKEPLLAKVMKHTRLYLTKIKQDMYKIKFLVDCFPAYTAKRPRDKSASSDSGTTSNVRTNGLLLPPQKGRMKSRWTEHGLRLGRERES